MNRKEVSYLAITSLIIVGLVAGIFYFGGQLQPHGYNISASNNQQYTCTSPDDPNLTNPNDFMSHVPKYNIYNGTQLIGVCINTNQAQSIVFNAAASSPYIYVGVGVAVIGTLAVVVVFMYWPQKNRLRHS